jgi:hypothetical protein
MAHAYREPCRVEEGADGKPVTFFWRGREYHVEVVLSHWRLRDRWWVPRTSEWLGDAQGPSRRYYYRVQCSGLAFYELYHDLEVGFWFLDRVLD